MPHATEREMLLAAIDRQIAKLERMSTGPSAGDVVLYRQALESEARRLRAMRSEMARVLRQLTPGVEGV